MEESTPPPTPPLQRRPCTPIPTRTASPADEYEFSSAQFEKETGDEPSGQREVDINEKAEATTTCEEERSDSLPSLIILHKIASYLSIGDAESVGALSRSSNITNSSIYMPGGHSLDAWCTARERSRSFEGMGHTNNSLHDFQQQQMTSYQTQLMSLEEEEDDEGWFVGNGAQSESLPHVALSPLGEWEPSDWEHENEGEMHQHQQQQWNPEEERVWTPAGEPTCERSDYLEVITPALTVVSCQSDEGDDCSGADSSDEESSHVRYEHRQRKRALQHKLAQAVFAHPHPLRDYCLDAYATAVRLSQKRNSQQQQPQQRANPNPETLRHRPDMSPSSKLHYCNEELPEMGEHAKEKATNSTAIVQHSPRQKRLSKRKRKAKILRMLINKLLNSIPLSVLLDLLESTFDLSIHTLFACGKITSISINTIISLLSNTAFAILNSLSSINIFELVLSAHRSVNKTGEKLASGLQSVATGVGSASNAALERLSRQGLALAGAGLSRGGGGMRNGMQTKVLAVENPLESKLFRRLHKMDNVSKLLSYSERIGEEAFGKAQKKRAQRMMHYNVSFRPFTATIQPATPKKTKAMKHNVSFDLSTKSPGSNCVEDSPSDNDSLSSESLYSNSGSMFMRTPTSFPPTPTSRLYYFERGSRFTENVIFLARDQLRVERGLDNNNEQTRAMSKALQEGSRLAVFDAAADAGGGIALSCGQHIATKVGNALYCSTRSMIPVMRNSFVYFEISVSPPPTVNDAHRNHPQMDVATLSIGLSTLEMPLNTLVGAWKGSTGLCTTGQVLMAGQWFAPTNTQESSYGSNSTVGCLVYLDDSSSHETKDGPIVMTDVTFNVNGIVVPPVKCSKPMGEQQQQPLSPDTQYDDSYDVPTLSLPVPRNQELFPTVTLHSPATCVMCRFNSEDLLASSRAEIGAPDGVTIFAVDGSVIIDSSSESIADDWLLDSCDTLTELAHDEVAL